MILVYTLQVSEIESKELGKAIASIPESIKENIMSTYQKIVEKGIEKVS